jgi:hypothetical protein
MRFIGIQRVSSVTDVITRGKIDVYALRFQAWHTWHSWHDWHVRIKAGWRIAVVLIRLLVAGFTSILMSKQFEIFNLSHTVVYQDMTYPLSHYYIASSHNTWVTAFSFDDVLLSCLRVLLHIWEVWVQSSAWRLPVLTEVFCNFPQSSRNKTFKLAMTTSEFITYSHPII